MLSARRNSWHSSWPSTTVPQRWIFRSCRAFGNRYQIFLALCFVGTRHWQILYLIARPKTMWDTTKVLRHCYAIELVTWLNQSLWRITTVQGAFMLDDVLEEGQRQSQLILVHHHHQISIQLFSRMHHWEMYIYCPMFKAQTINLGNQGWLSLFGSIITKTTHYGCHSWEPFYQHVLFRTVLGLVVVIIIVVFEVVSQALSGDANVPFVSDVNILIVVL